jgi:His/Glu/Gln/Arg/opine family amino acid ABC transporter permease subunit
VIGLLLALGKLSKIRALRMFCAGYIEVARGVPALAILFLLYFGLVPTGLVLDAFVAGFIGLGLSVAGYIAEVFRAGIEAVHKGHRQTALSVGMTPSRAFATSFCRHCSIYLLSCSRTLHLLVDPYT